MFTFKVLTHPLNEVVLEYPLDELVKQVWGDELVDVSIGEVFCKRLGGGGLWIINHGSGRGTHRGLVDDAVGLPQGFRTKSSLACVCVFG